MKHLSKALIVVAGLAVSACSNPDRFGDQYNNGAGSSGTAGGVAGTAQDPQSPLYFQQTIGDRVLFAVDQSTLSPTATATLDGQAQWLATNTAYNAIIEGHADEQGTREYNVALGARRASSVQSYLIERGVAPGRLRTVSYGKERPLAICSDESCYQQNRRAVTVLTTGAGT